MKRAPESSNNNSNGNSRAIRRSRRVVFACVLFAALVSGCSDDGTGGTDAAIDGSTAGGDASAEAGASDAGADGPSAPPRTCIAALKAPSYGDATCPVNRPAQPDLIDQALAKVGLDRCKLVFSPADKLGPASVWNDPYRLPFYDGVHDNVLRGPPFARALVSELDDAAASALPVARAIHVAMSYAGFGGERCTAPQPLDREAPLVEALAALITARGGKPDRAKLAGAAAGVPAAMRVALASVVQAITAAAAARDKAFEGADLGKTASSPGVDLATLYRYVTTTTLRAKDNKAIAPRQPWVQRLLQGKDGGFKYERLYVAALRLAAAVEQAKLSRFAGADAKLDVATPIGRVIVGGAGDDTYTVATHGAAIALLVDTGGNDTYRVPAGATAGADNPVSVAVDLGGDDRYGYDEVPHAKDGKRLVSDADGRAQGGNPASSNGPVSLSEVSRQGAARLGVGLLFDLGAGKDSYRSLRMSQGFGALGVGVLYDDGGDDDYAGEAGVQGAGIFGIGLLLDAGVGKDRYRTYHASQGFAYAMAVGVLYDSAGDDQYIADNGDPAQGGDPLYFTPQLPGKGNSSFVQGAGFGRRADTTDRIFMSGGLGVLRDVSGNDSYQASVFAQATGYWFGTGVLADGAGDDRYDGLWYVQGATAHYALSLFIDDGGNDAYNQSLEPKATSIGVGHDFSVSFHIDGGGDDVYRAPGLSLGSGNENGFGLMINRGGKDTYVTRGKRTLGGASISGTSAGNARAGVFNVGLFIDSGGADSYSVDSKADARDDTVWTYSSSHSTPTKELGVGLDGSGQAALP